MNFHSGSYADFATLDLSPTNKHAALEAVAKLIGETSDRILRIGDQGAELGNDYELLASPSGFSVGTISRSIDSCFPVVDVAAGKQLKSTQGTEALLNNALLMPAITLAPTQIHEHLPALRDFERLALQRARLEDDYVLSRLRFRLRYLFPDSSSQLDAHNLHLSDLIDLYSGGVHLSEYEADHIDRLCLPHDVFELKKLLYGAPDFPRTSWSMFTDSGILLRGPAYYFTISGNSRDRSLEIYTFLVRRFLDSLPEFIEEVAALRPNLLTFKLALAVFDNVRNILLTLFNSLIKLVRADANTTLLGLPTIKRLYAILEKHTKNLYTLLLDPDEVWQELLIEYQISIPEITNTVDIVIKTIQKNQTNSDSEVLPKWREADNFLQSVSAVQLGLHELKQGLALERGESFLAVGLAAGGSELAAIAAALGVRLATPSSNDIDRSAAEGTSGTRMFGRIEPWIARISIYSQDDINEKIRNGKYEDVARILLSRDPLVPLTDHKIDFQDRPTILFDDNITTGMTLQLARDLLVLRGAIPIGAIIVRFPGISRRQHMSMPGHGFPDPRIFFGFIRGLVAASPYSRLNFPGESGIKDKPYIDVTGVFDKSRKRIERYLKKNGEVKWIEEK